MKRVIKKLLKLLHLVPYNELKYVKAELAKWKTTPWPPGHYYSPEPDIDYVKEHPAIFAFKERIGDVDLNSQGQFELLKALASYKNEYNLPEDKDPAFRFYSRNSFFSFSDAYFLFSVVKNFKPASIIEIGSGFSSALLLDMNEKHASPAINLTFIEPFPEERLLNLLRPGEAVRLLKQFVQDVDTSVFTQLVANDILFVDSSHVGKCGSDVNFILFEVLPVLKPGVIIHFHDIFYPFEYPKEWVLSGRAWNEGYLLHAFLMNNSKYEILLFTSYLDTVHEDWLTQNLPFTQQLHEKRNNGKAAEEYLPIKGQSLWIRKVS